MPVYHTCSFWEDARPGGREPVCIQADFLHQGNIFPVTMIMIYGDITSLMVGNFAGRVREGIPDGWTFAVLIPGAFHLVSR